MQIIGGVGCSSTSSTAPHHYLHGNQPVSPSHHPARNNSNKQPSWGPHITSISITRQKVASDPGWRLQFKSKAEINCPFFTPTL